MNDFAIGVDGYNLAMPNGTGVASYGYALADTIRAMDIAVTGVFGVPVGAIPRLREVLFYDAIGRGYAPPPAPLAIRWLRLARQWLQPVRAVDVATSGLVQQRPFEHRLPTLDRIVSSPFLFERAERHFKRTKRFLTLSMPNPPPIMHWTYPVPVQLRGARNVYTLHDLVPLRLPQTTLDRKRHYFNVVDHIAKTAAHVCTVSQSSLDDIVATLPEAGGRTTNTYQVVPLPAGTFESSPFADAAEVEGIFGLKRRGYFLYFGAIEPKKNVGRLIEAYLTLNTETPLVIVGARAWQADEELRLAEVGKATAGGAEGKGKVRNRIVRLEYLPRRLLFKLVRGARAVAFPSLYEGFGLPVLEAMALGTPVLTSDRSALPEVAGSGALTVDPFDVGAIAAGLARLDRDEAVREALARQGLVEAARFSVDAYRARLHAMYAATMEQPPLG